MQDEIEELGYTLYGISRDTPENHQGLIEQHDLGYELLSDAQLEVGLAHDFVEEEEQIIYRGYIAVQPESGEMTREVDYLAGENSDEVLEVLENMNP
ncbi:AhpC/TSA family protein [Alkalicoccus daliensis]|uniref:AhpC/TSA family protein n=1 Tax=Alkalicoccus daliensis TaxID=745820 RepID=A0A1H0GUY8_9BACI|nr:AhpC/TSA family protein [Alkalicoccus daliensis]